MWLVVHHKMLDRRSACPLRALQHPACCTPSPYGLRDQEAKTINHLLVSCTFAHLLVSCTFTGELRFHLLHNDVLSLLEETSFDAWWLRINGMVNGQVLKELNSVILGAWIHGVTGIGLFNVWSPDLQDPLLLAKEENIEHGRG